MGVCQRTRCCVVILLALCALGEAFAAERELRGVWYTPRQGRGFVWQSDIALAMDSIANNHFNTVFFNVWSQGYPLFRSRTFFEATGGRYWTDPAAGERDLLAEAVAEAHRRGLDLEAWFEYGFVGGYSGNRPAGSARGPLLDSHPDWRGRSSSGSDSIILGTGGAHYWMSHLHPGVLQFLIELSDEVAEQYDVDAVELDRIRYPNLDWGYDSATVSAYRAETGINLPPDKSDPAWMRWRADKLNAFAKSAYNSAKSHNPTLLFTNAPSQYGSGNYYAAYKSFLQDWAAWVSGGYLDAAYVQMYVDPSTFSQYLQSVLQYRVNDPLLKKKIFPGFAVIPDRRGLSVSDVSQIVQTTRDNGLLGDAIWFYTDLGRSPDGSGKTYWSFLKEGVYAQPAVTPLRDEPDWRSGTVLINENDPASIDTTGRWEKSSLLLPIGYFGPCLQAQGAAPAASISYYADMPASAWYDVYAYIAGYGARTKHALYDLYDSSRTAVRTSVDESDGKRQGWAYLGTRYYTEGRHRKVVRLSNEGAEPSNPLTAAGGLMLLLDRRLSPGARLSGVSEGRSETPRRYELQPAFPNPFNPSTTLTYSLPSDSFVHVEVVDLLGRTVQTLVKGVYQGAGEHRVAFDGAGIGSGIYFARFEIDGAVQTRKLILVR